MQYYVGYEKELPAERQLSGALFLSDCDRKDMVIISEKKKNVKEGSAESIVMHQKEARSLKNAKLINDMSADFTQLKNIYDLLKRKDN